MSVSKIATEIARQIGPVAFAMMGTRKDKWADGDALLFTVRGCPKWKKIRIDLDAADTYSLMFYQIDGAFNVTSKYVYNVHVDMLHDLIESETGLFLSLSARD